MKLRMKLSNLSVCDHTDIIRASGKTGEGVPEILEIVVNRIPHPNGNERLHYRLLFFDSVFNSFRGIIAYFKILRMALFIKVIK